MNGLIAADWTPHPGLRALKYVQQPVKVEMSDEGASIVVTNRYDFTNLAEVLQLHWELSQEGTVIRGGMMDLPSIRPGASAVLELPAQARVQNPEKETWLNLSFRARKASRWWERSHELAYAQFAIGGEWTVSRPLASDTELRLQRDGDSIAIFGPDWEIIFDARQRTMTRWVVDGRELLERGALPDFWRAATDNDRGAGLHVSRRGEAQGGKALSDSNGWRNAAASWNPREPSVEMLSNNHVRVRFSGAIPRDRAHVTLTYTIAPSGRVAVDFTIGTERNLPPIPRVGTEWRLPLGMKNVRWYGRGPDPTYADRKFERIGVYSTTVMDNWVDYSAPQENGNKVDVRWMEITDDEGVGLRVLADRPLSCNVMPYTAGEIEDKAYSWLLPAPARTILNVDYAQMGVAGDNSWGATALPQYLLDSYWYSYAYFMEPVRP